MTDNKYVIGPDIDLDAEEIHEPDGTRLTEARARDLAEETLRVVRGRPSLSSTGSSPRVSFRVSEQDMADIQRLADARKVSVSEIAREALADYLHHAS